MKKGFPVAVIFALTAGLIAQFVWKMIYFPEPILLVVFELTFIVGIAVCAVYQILRE